MFQVVMSWQTAAFNHFTRDEMKQVTFQIELDKG